MSQRNDTAHEIATRYGLSRYDSGRPCKRCGCTLRQTNNGACVDCRSEKRKARYREHHPEVHVSTGQGIRDARAASEVAYGRLLASCGNVLDGEGREPPDVTRRHANDYEWYEQKLDRLLYRDSWGNPALKDLLRKWQELDLDRRIAEWLPNMRRGEHEGQHGEVIGAAGIAGSDLDEYRGNRITTNPEYY